MGHPGFGTGDDLRTIIYSTVYNTLIAQAMSIDLQTGRFGLAMGATLVLSGLIGSDVLIFARLPYDLILMGVVLAVLVVGYDYTKIGYDRKALQGSQKIAVDVGVKEMENAIWCYAAAGALLALSAAVYLSKFGKIAPTTGLGHNGHHRRGG